MKTLKTTLLVILLWISGATVFAQSAIKFKGYQVATREYNYYYGKWTNWSAWASCNVLISFNFNDDRIIIYSSKIQVYDIVSSEDKGYDRDGDNVLEIYCEDADGIRCNVRVIRRRDGTDQLYVDYNNVSWVYNIRRT